MSVCEYTEYTEDLYDEKQHTSFTLESQLPNNRVLRIEAGLRTSVQMPISTSVRCHSVRQLVLYAVGEQVP